jgi:DUF4097 and DUF4098 domain-containing protein YvlB
VQDCEVREFVLDARALRVDAAPNGSIEVKRWERRDVLVRVRVSATAPTRERAAELTRATTIRTTSDVSADVPRTGRNESVSASYQVFVPAGLPLETETVNGSITLAGVDGAIRFSAVNGSVLLDGVGGDVEGQTVNGSIDVRLEGTTWAGEGLSVQTTNGRVSMTVPRTYSSEIHAETRNGGIRLPGVASRSSASRRSVTLGSGGPPLRARTVNGSIDVAQL